MAVTLALVAAAIKGVNAFQDWADGTTAVNKYNEALEKSEQTISDNEKSISDYNSEIETNKKKIEELQELQSNGTITDAQKAEIDNLQYQNALLDEKIEKLKQANEEELKSQARTAENKFNTQFNESGDDTKSTNAKDVIERVSKDYGGNGSYEGISWTQALGGNDNDKGVAQLAKLKLATDAYNQAVSDFENSENDVTREDVDNAKETLDILTQDFEKNRESLYNSLTSEMEKMEKAKGSGYTFVGGQDDSDSYDHNMSEEEWQQSQKATSAYDKVKDKINSAIKIANEAVVKLQDSSYNQIENSIGGLDWDDLGSDSSSSSGSGSDSSDKDNSKDYDLIERKIKKLESAISALDSTVSDTYTSWENRNSTLIYQKN